VSTVTIQTRLTLTPAQAAALAAFADLTSRAQRALHAARMTGKTVGQCKPVIMRRFGLTARHFNGLRVDYDGKLRASITGQQQTVDRLVRQQARNAERLARAKARGDARAVHGLQRRAAHLASRHIRALAARQRPPALCFGGATFFRAQHHLAANGFADHAAWRTAWLAARASQVFLVGSKDETAGNQSAQYDTIAQTLTLRLPDETAAAHDLPRRMVIPDIRFAQEPALLANALARGLPISYRLMCRARRTRSGAPTSKLAWYVLATTDRIDAEVITSASRGSLGVDLNVDHLAWCRVDASGNLVDHGRIPLLLVGRRRTQAQADVSAAVAPLVAMAARDGVPLSLERLDLTAKADQRRGRSTRTNRRLSAFSTRMIRTLIASKAARAGVEVAEVNPAFSSIIGEAKFAAGYGLSRHAAAAWVIARRGLENSAKAAGRRTPSGRVVQMRERLRRRSATLVVGAVGSPGSARALPVRNRARHVWSDWGRFARTLKSEAAAARGRSGVGGCAPEAASRRQSEAPTGPSDGDPSPPRLGVLTTDLP
jgi:IS605 OrfB family transposase